MGWETLEHIRTNSSSANLLQLAVNTNPPSELCGAWVIHVGFILG